MKQIAIRKVAMFFSIVTMFLSLITTGFASDEELFIVCGGDEELKIGCIVGDDELSPSMSIFCGNTICESFESCSTCVPDCGNCVTGTGKEAIADATDIEEEKDLLISFIEDNLWLIILLMFIAGICLVCIIYLYHCR